MIDFPGSPTDGQQFTAGGNTWYWSTATGAWLLVATTATGPTGPTGPTGAGSTGPTGPTGSGGTGPTGPTGIGWNVYQTTGYVYFQNATGYNWS